MVTLYVFDSLQRTGSLESFVENRTKLVGLYVFDSLKWATL